MSQGKRNREKVMDRRRAKKAKTGRVIKEKFLEEQRLPPPVTAITDVQKEFLRSLQTHDVVALVSPAGTGKSFVTMSEVSDWLKKGLVDKVVLTRPVIPMGRSLGMLPSTMQQKFEPYLLPLLEVLWNRYGKSYYEHCISTGAIELLPPEYSRGRSVAGVMIIDEAQSLHPNELYTLLTRMQEGGKLILIGDPSQTDIHGENAIDWLEGFVERNPKLEKHIKVLKATSDDIVRSGLCKELVKAKERENKCRIN